MTEIEEMHTRLTSVLRERTEFLKSSVDKYLIVESKTLKDLKENLELELANIKVSIHSTYNNKIYVSVSKVQGYPHPSDDPRSGGGRHGQHLFQKVVKLF